jgi:hypothetical protein
MEPPSGPRITSLHEFHSTGDKVIWDQTLKRPQMITSLEWDPMSWMTSDNEIKIWTRSMEDEGECEVFCQNLGGHWHKEHKPVVHKIGESSSTAIMEISDSE